MVTEISCSSEQAASRAEYGMPRAFGSLLGYLAIGILASGAAFAAEQGDPARGARVYRACAACHSLAPDKNMTGPSLAGLWDRKAGSLASFGRYSPALKSASVVWDQQTLDEWLKDPRRFIPQNRMTFAGIADARARADLVAFLKEATQPGHAPQGQTAQQDDGMGGMNGMMGDRASVIFADPAEITAAIKHEC